MRQKIYRFVAILILFLSGFVGVAEENRPNWIGSQFSSNRNKNHYYWSGDNDEKGHYASGEGQTKLLAYLDALVNTSSYVYQVLSETKTIEYAENGEDVEKRVFVSRVQDISNFVKIMDNYRDENYSSEYILLFISDNNIEKLLQDEQESEKIWLEETFSEIGEEGIMKIKIIQNAK